MKRTGTRFRPRLAANHYDAIVIGSGIGGLTTAALLSKLGKRVCVLEQHYTAGGYTHSYEREGYEWDVGVHYIGEVHKPWSMIRRVFDVISDGKLEWAPMDAHYDRIVIGEQSYDYVAGRDEFKAEMKRHFPAEAVAIDRYVELLSEVSARVPRFFAGQALPRSLGMLYARLRRLWLHQANQGMNRLISQRVLGHEANEDESPTVLDTYANTSSAGSIIAFHKHSEDLKAGDIGLICSFGAGYSAGSVFVRKVA